MPTTSFVPIHFLADMYRDAGLTVNILAGAETRGARMYANGYENADVRMLDRHHTAQSIAMSDVASIAYMTFHAPYPVMCNVYPHKETPGMITICAAGPTYTAGRGGPLGHVPEDRGNKYGWSMECPNNGVGEPWPAHLQDTIVTATAVEIEFFKNWGPGWQDWPFTMNRVPAHFQWAPGRKIDPFGPSRFTNGESRMWTMAKFLDEVQAKYKELYVIAPPPIIPPDPNPGVPIMTPTLGVQKLAPRRIRDSRDGGGNPVSGEFSITGLNPSLDGVAIEATFSTVQPTGMGRVECNGTTILLYEEGDRSLNTVTVPLDEEGRFTIVVHGAPTHVIVDRVSYYVKP